MFFTGATRISRVPGPAPTQTAGDGDSTFKSNEHPKKMMFFTGATRISRVPGPAPTQTAGDGDSMFKSNEQIKCVFHRCHQDQQGSQPGTYSNSRRW